jgi:hypothetical protein
MDIRPFSFDVAEEQLTDLRRRITATKWRDREVDASQGVQLDVIQAFADLPRTGKRVRIRAHVGQLGRARSPLRDRPARFGASERHATRCSCRGDGSVSGRAHRGSRPRSALHRRAGRRDLRSAVRRSAHPERFSPVIVGTGGAAMPLVLASG